MADAISRAELAAMLKAQRDKAMALTLAVSNWVNAELLIGSNALDLHQFESNLSEAERSLRQAQFYLNRAVQILEK